MTTGKTALIIGASRGLGYALGHQMPDPWLAGNRHRSRCPAHRPA